MTGATITVTEVAPNCGMKFIFYTGTTDSSNKLDFSAYRLIKLVLAWDATNPGATTEAVTAVTDAGDVTYTNGTNAVVGFAFVVE